MLTTHPTWFDRVPDAFIIDELERIVPDERPALRLPLHAPEPLPAEPPADEAEPPRVIIIEL